MRLHASVMGWLILACIAGCSRKPEVIAPREKDAREQSAAGADEKAIRELFTRYYRHLANKEGKEAVACLDQATLDWHEGLRKDALQMTREQFDKQELYRRWMVLQWRVQFDRRTLESKTGAELLAMDFSAGWLGDENKNPPTLSYVGSNGKSAHALVADATEVPRVFFENQGGVWKVNLTKLQDRTQQMLTEGQVRSGLDAMAFLEESMAKITGGPVDKRVFDGPLDKIESKP